MPLLGTDYGLCATQAEFDCICNGPQAIMFMTLCLPTPPG